MIIPRALCMCMENPPTRCFKYWGGIRKRTKDLTTATPSRKVDQYPYKYVEVTTIVIILRVVPTCGITTYCIYNLTEAETKCNFYTFSTTNERCDEDVFIEHYQMIDLSSILTVYIWLHRENNLRFQCPDCQRLGEICCSTFPVHSHVSL